MIHDAQTNALRDVMPPYPRNGQLSAEKERSRKKETAEPQSSSRHQTKI